MDAIMQIFLNKISIILMTVIPYRCVVNNIIVIIQCTLFFYTYVRYN